MKSKKVFILVVSLVFALLILSGCQNQNKLNNEEPQEEQSKQNTTEVQENQEKFNNAQIKEIGYIHNFNAEKMNFAFDPVEWITADDLDRIKELNLDRETDLPNGFYEYDPEADITNYSISDTTQYEIIDWSSGDYGKPAKVSLEDFVAHLNSFDEFTPPFWIVIDGETVISISEQYTP